MAKEGETKGGKFLKFAFTTAVGVTMGMAVSPAFADVGTWFKIAHDESNLRAKAWANVVEPLTSIFPQHMGLMPDKPGLLTPLMNMIIGDELNKLERQRAQAEQADRLRDNFSQPASPEPSETTPTLEKESLPAEDPFSGSNPLGANFMDMDEAANDSSIIDTLLDYALVA